MIFDRDKTGNSRKTLQIGSQKIVLDSRGLIPAVLQVNNEKKGQAVNLVYLNETALEMCVTRGELYIFRRSRQGLEKVLDKDGNPVRVNSIKLSSNRRALIINIYGTEKEILENAFVHRIYIHPNEIGTL